MSPEFINSPGKAVPSVSLSPIDTWPNPPPRKSTAIVHEQPINSFRMRLSLAHTQHPHKTRWLQLLQEAETGHGTLVAAPERACGLSDCVPSHDQHGRAKPFGTNDNMTMRLMSSVRGSDAHTYQRQMTSFRIRTAERGKRKFNSSLSLPAMRYLEGRK